MTRPDAERDARRITDQAARSWAAWAGTEAAETMRPWRETLRDFAADLVDARAENERLQASADATHKACSDAIEARGVIANENERLRAALADAVKWCGLCHGTGARETSCTLCGDSTYDHFCNDGSVPCTQCESWRAALAAPPAAPEPGLPQRDRS